MDAPTRMETALARLRRDARKAKIAPPAAPKLISKLAKEAGPLPPELRDYFRLCDGVTLPEDMPIGSLLSVQQVLNLDSPGFFAIGDDGLGNYDLVAARVAVHPGAVLFWDHETGELEAVASSVCTYVEMWVERALVVSRPKKDSPAMFEALASLFDPEVRTKLLRELNPEALKLRRSKKFLAQLGDVTVEQVDRTGKIRERMGVNPFSKEPMALPAPPRKRRPG